MSATTLSRAYAASVYRGGPALLPRYQAAPSKRSCDECAAVQRETRGVLRRVAAKHRRSIPGPVNQQFVLLLCGPHAIAWKARDLADGVPAGHQTR